jgi:hypothetical protein
MVWAALKIQLCPHLEGKVGAQGVEMVVRPMSV